MVSLPEEGKPARIVEMAVNAIPALPELNLQQSAEIPVQPKVTGRHYSKWNADELTAIQFPNVIGDTVNRTAEPYGFDLWTIAEAMRAKKGDAFLLTFSVQATEPSTAFLGLGCSDQAVVFCNSQPVHAVSGWRELLFNQDIVPLRLNPGANIVSVVCQRSTPWSAIPKDHFEPEWSVGLELFSSAEAAWQGHRRHVYHPLDRPILPDFDQIRIEAKADGREQVTVRDLAGREVLSGAAQNGGTVQWAAHSKMPALPFFGMLVVGSDLAEPILICPEDEIVDFSTHLAGTRERSRSSPAWKFRLEHLLKPAHRLFGDEWWQRKLLMALLKVSTEDRVISVDQSLDACPAARVEFGEYTSSVDGTRQFYRIFRSHRPSTAIPPLLVIVPTVPRPVRPYLESAIVANQREQEQLASVADTMGVDLLWPGIVDVDYGGELMRTQLRECIGAVNGESNAGIYLVGLCSAGVSAIGYAKTLPINGLILQSPVVNRKYAKWLPEMDPFEPRFPLSIKDREQTERNLELLARLPVKLIYDIDIPGHGDRDKSAALVKTVRANGGIIEDYWRPVPFKFLPWGERLKFTVSTWLTWVKETEAKLQSAPHLPIISPQPVQPATVKTAMLQGFTITTTEDPVFAHWLEGWMRTYRIYRGAEPALVAPPDSVGSSLPITFRLLKPEEQTSAALGRLFPGAPQVMPGSLEKAGIGPGTTLFGFRLINSEAKSGIEILRSDTESLALPPFDPLLDGACRGALWKQTNGAWTLVEAWL